MLQNLLLLAWFALPAIVSIAMLCVRQRIHPIWIVGACLACVITGTFILANYVWAVDAQLLAEIDKYEPGTPEAARASENWASDTGRSFLLLLSPALTTIGYGTLFLLLFGLRSFARRKSPATVATVNAKTHAKNPRQPSEDRKTNPPPLT